MPITYDDKNSAIVIKDLGEFENFLDTRFLVTRLSNFLALRTKSRTLGGVDNRLKQFQPYSEGYANFRAERGRNTRVDLTFSGQMLAGITATTDNDKEARVHMVDAIQGGKAIIHQLGIGNMPRRSFFGYSKADTTAQRGINKISQTEFDKAIKKAGFK